MATRKPLVIVSGVTQQIADADAISANGGVQRGTAGALALGTDANTTSVNLGTNAAATAINIGTGMGTGDTIQIGGGGIGGSLTRVMGDLQVDGVQTFVGGSTFNQNATFEGDVTFGNAVTDTVAFLSRVGPVANPDIHFLKEVNHVIDVDASTTLNAAGGTLTIGAGAGNGTGLGGNVNVDAGNGATGGLINIGATFASSISIGGIVANPTITFLGTGDVVKSGGGAIRVSGGQFEMSERGSDPATAANIGAVYTKDVAGSTQLFYRSDSSGTVTQLTGVAPVASDLDSVLAVGNTTGTSATTSGANIIFSGDGVQQDSIVVGGQAGLTFSIAFSGAATGAGAPVSVSAQQGGAASAGGAITVTAGSGGSGSGAGGALTLSAGSGSAGTGNGGLATLRGGAAIGTGAGGGAAILGRDGAGVNQAGGGVTVTGGTATGSGAAGTVVITAGAGGSSSAGANASLIGGAGPTGAGGFGGSTVVRGGHATGTSGTGGAVSVSGGNGTNAGTGGGATFSGGQGGTGTGIGGACTVAGGVGGATGGIGGLCTVSGGASQASSAGGNLLLQGGESYASGFAGGNVTVQGGVPTNGNGGAVSINGGDGVGAARNGGALTMRGGAATTTGTPGDAQLTGGAAVTTSTGGFSRVVGGVGGAATGATPGGAGGFGRAQGGVGGAAAGGSGAGGAGGSGSALGGTGGAGSATGVAGAGGAANVLAGNAGANGGAGGANGGSVTVDAGAGSGAGTAGTVSVGTGALSGAAATTVTLGGATTNVRLGAGFEEFANGVSAAVSPAGEGRIRYNNTSGTFQVSMSGAAYVDLATGGAATLSATLAAGNTTGANDIQFNGADGGPGESIIIQDAYASALRIREGSNSYLLITTTNAAEQMTFGNNTTNPQYLFRGTGAVEINGANLNLTEEIAHTVQVKTSTTLNAAGGQLDVKSGQGNGTGAGGELNVNAGAGGATGDGGDTWLRGGAGGSTSGAGGLVSVVGGGATSGAGGAASIDGGLGTTNGNILIGTNQVNAINIGNTSDNPVTSFQGTGAVRLTGTNQYLSLIGSGAGTGGAKLSIFESANVTPGADTGIVYTKDDGGDTELFYADPAGNFVQITKDGSVNAPVGPSNSIIISGLTTTGVTTGHAVYVSAASTVTACDANGTAAQARCFGFYEGTSGSVKTAGVCTPVFTTAPSVGDQIYLSLTAGEVTPTAPSGTGEYVAPVGIALTTTTMLIQVLTPVLL